MARPIRETPILRDDDALRFVNEMQRVESISQEQRMENIHNFQTSLQQALHTINVCI